MSKPLRSCDHYVQEQQAAIVLHCGSGYGVEPAANGTDTFLAVVRVLDADGTPALALALGFALVLLSILLYCIWLVRHASCLNSTAARDD